MLYSIILACTFYGGIGYKNTIPWEIKEDLHKFRIITTVTNASHKKNAVIMGRNTWESLPYKPLRNRMNIVISREDDYYNEKYKDMCDVFFVSNLDDAFKYCEYNLDKIDRVFVIGGAMIYNECFTNEKYKTKIDRIYLSLIVKNYMCDRFIDVKNILQNYIINMNDIEFNNKYISMVAYNNN